MTLPRRNIGIAYPPLPGAPGDSIARWHGREAPYQTPSGLIIPQVIAWPWTEDDAGHAFPSGIVGVRTMADGIDTERDVNWAYAPHGRWIAVPDSLPGGYTARRTRDVNKGPPVDDQVNFPPEFRLKGAPWYQCYLTGGDQTTGGSSLRVIPREYVFNQGISSGTTDPEQLPNYRPHGGGEPQAVHSSAWLPLNISDKAIYCQLQNVGNEMPRTYFGWPANTGPTSAPEGSQGIVSGHGWLQLHPGWRSITVQVGTVDKSKVIEGHIRFAHNSDNSRGTLDRWGDVTDFQLDFAGSDMVAGDEYDVISHTVSNYLAPSVGTLRAYHVAYLYFVNTTTAPVGNPPLGHPDHPAVWASPRCDVPLWFTATGRGLVAPGGLVT